MSGLASALRALLTDGARWHTLSGRARVNADRFRWEACSRPLADLVEEEVGV